MQSKYFTFSTGFCLFAILCVTCLSQTDNKRVVAQGDSIKVIATEQPPRDPSLEIYIGPPRDLPWFVTKGKDGRVDTASINVIDGTNSPTNKASELSITEKGVRLPVASIVRKMTPKESFMLYLFTEDRDDKVVGLFDLNIDGQWDVKKNPTKQNQNSIFFNDKWLEVDEIAGLNSENPTAAKGKDRYEFLGTWKRGQNGVGVRRRMPENRSE